MPDIAHCVRDLCAIQLHSPCSQKLYIISEKLKIDLYYA